MTAWKHEPEKKPPPPPEKPWQAQRRMGRPLKLTEELTDRICDLIANGNYLETAAAVCGIDKTTLFDWIKRGARLKAQLAQRGRRIGAEDKLFVDFSHSVEVAMATAETRDVLTISIAARKDWNAAAWRLSRKHADRWGPKDKHIITAEEAGPPPAGAMDLSRLTHEQLDELEQIARAAAGSDVDPPGEGQAVEG